MILPGRRRRGFALVAVIAVMALLLVYLAAVQGSTRQTVQMGGVARARAERSEALASAATLVALQKTAPASLQLEPIPGRPLAAEVTLRPLAPADPLWRQSPGLEPLPDDALLELRWSDRPGGQPERAIINLEGRRRGLVVLRAAAEPAA